MLSHNGCKTLLFLSLLPLAGAQQPYVISTVAGFGLQPFGGSGGLALNADLVDPAYVAVDSVGNVFISDSYYQQVFRVSVDGTITVYAGSGTAGLSGDNGPATAAQMNNPLGLTVDAAGNLFIMDNGNARIRKVTPGGTMTTFALVPGVAVTMDAAGNLFASQLLGNVIHEITPSGVVTTFAGTGQPGSAGDGGLANAAQLFNPTGLRFDAAGNLYVADTGNHKIRKITPQGIISTFAGNGKVGFAGDGMAAINATLGSPADVAVGEDGSVYFSDNGHIRVVTPDGIISTFAGGGTSLADGPATQASLGAPYGIAFDNAGNLLLAVISDRIVRQVTGNQIMTIAGELPSSEMVDNIPATSGRLLDPYGVTFDSSGVIYVSDSSDNRIRRITQDGNMTTLAGDGLPDESTNGTPPVELGSPRSLVFDPLGNLDVAVNTTVRQINTDGLVNTIVGSGAGFLGDNGPATAALLAGTGGLALDANGNLYIADTGNNRIRRVDAASKFITTIAGTGNPAFGGDNGPATTAMLFQPNGVVFDNSGNLYVADSSNSRIRKISPDGTITTVAGNGTAADSGDGGDASAAGLFQPTAIAIDTAGNLYIASNVGTRIRMVDAATNIISTVAGTSVAGFSGDGGFGASAMINAVGGLALDGFGDIYFSDSRNYRVRKLAPAPIYPAGVLNAATLLPGPVAPGEIVVIDSSALSGAQAIGAQVGSSGMLVTNLGGVQVLFDGNPAPLLSVQANQVAAVVPYEVAGQTSTQLQLAVNGQNTNSFALPVAATSPGIFTQNSAATGALPILNADYSVNSPANPASVGDVLTITATDEGQTNPPGVDGLLASSPAPMPIAPVSVQIGGISASVVYAGGNPGVTAGFLLVNVQIPAGVSSGSAIPVVLSVGGVASQGGVTIAIQ